MKEKLSVTLDRDLVELVELFALEQGRLEFSTALNQIVYRFFKNDPELRKRLRA